MVYEKYEDPRAVKAAVDIGRNLISNVLNFCHQYAAEHRELERFELQVLSFSVTTQLLDEVLQHCIPAHSNQAVQTASHAFHTHFETARKALEKANDQIKKHPEPSDVIRSMAFGNELAEVLSYAQESITTAIETLKVAADMPEAFRKLRSNAPARFTVRPPPSTFRAPGPLLSKLMRLLAKQVSEDVEDGLVILLSGMFGVGKTTLARHVAHLTRVWFPDGVYWVHCGEQCDVIKCQGSLLLNLGASKEEFEAKNEAGSEKGKRELEIQDKQKLLREMLDGKKYLLILDDVWSSSVLSAFPPPSSKGKCLVTSRKKGIVDGEEVEFSNKAYSEDVALQILAAHAMDRKPIPDECVAVGQEIAQFCDGCALGLAVIGKVLYLAGERCKNEPVKLASMWKEKLDEYRTYSWDPSFVPAEYDRDSEGEKAQHRSINGEIQVSFDDAEVTKDVHLPTFRCMAFFPSGDKVSSQDVQELWRALHGNVAARCRGKLGGLMESFAARNLVTIIRPGEFDDLLVHDLVGDFLRGTLTEEEVTHLCNLFETPNRSSHDNIRLNIILIAFAHLARTEEPLDLVEERVLQKVVRVSVLVILSEDRSLRLCAQDLVRTLLDNHTNYRSKIVGLIRGELKELNDPAYCMISSDDAFTDLNLSNGQNFLLHMISEYHPPSFDLFD